MSIRGILAPFHATAQGQPMGLTSGLFNPKNRFDFHKHSVLDVAACYHESLAQVRALFQKS